MESMTEVSSMNERRHARWFAILATVAVILCCLNPPKAYGKEGDAPDPRHSVVFLECGVMLNGGWSPIPFNDGPAYVAGTAFFVGKQGENPQFLITNQHVVRYYELLGRGQLSIINVDGNLGTLKPVLRVYYDVNTWEEAYVVESDDVKDLAILKLDKPTNARSPLVVGRTDESMVGDTVRVVGFPGISDNIMADPVSTRSETDATITTGTISRLFVQSGTGVRHIQTDADIASGNSGGPMVEENGYVIGVNTWSAIDRADNEQLNYSVDMSAAEPLLQRNNIPYDTEDDIAAATTTTTTTENKSDSSPSSTSESTEASTSESSSTTDTVAPAPAPADSLPVPLIAGIAVAIAAIVVIVVVLTRRKAPANKPQQSNAATSTPARPAPAPVSPTAPAAQSSQRSRDDSGFRLQGISGALAGKRYMVPVSSHLTVGRGDGCNIAVPAGTAGVSTRHCEVWVEGGQIYLMDLGSTYGTFVDPGTKLTSGQPVRIAEGSTFWLGDKAQSFSVIEKRG